MKKMIVLISFKLLKCFGVILVSKQLRILVKYLLILELRGESMKEKSYLPNISWTFSGNIVYAATQFFILSVIAKIGGPGEVGIFTLSLAIVSPIFLLLNVKLR